MQSLCAIETYYIVVCYTCSLQVEMLHLLYVMKDSDIST